jgi:hypothetical protein
MSDLDPVLFWQAPAGAGTMCELKTLTHLFIHPHPVLAGATSCTGCSPGSYVAINGADLDLSMGVSWTQTDIIHFTLKRGVHMFWF